MLTSRAMRITKVLLEIEAPITVTQLAAYVCTSERAIRYDFKVIVPWLREYDLELDRRPGVGVLIVGSTSQKALALGTLTGVEPHSFHSVIGADDRIWSMLGWLLSSKDPVSVEFFSRILGVSKRTIYNDVDTLSKLLATKELELVSQRGKLYVMGDEVSCRSLMVDFLRRSISTDELGALIAMVRDHSHAQFLQRSDPSMAGPLRHLLEELGDQDLVSKIGSILATVQRTFHIRIPSGVSGALTAHLLIMLARVKHGRIATAPPGHLLRLRRRPEWTIGTWILSALRELLTEYTLPDSEVVGIVQYIVSCRADGHGFLGPDQILALSQEELGLYARVVVERVGEYLNINLLEDVELRAGLVEHLYGSLDKISTGLPVLNPILPDIQKRFPKLYSAVKRAVLDAANLVNFDIPEDEVGWITLHLGAALERLANHHRTWRGMVACPSGIGVAQLLRARLGSEFPYADFRTTSALDEHQLWESTRSFNADVVISTISIGHGPVPVVTVSPFLTPRDVARITLAVHGTSNTNEDHLIQESKAPARVLSSRINNQIPSLAELVQEDLIAVDVMAVDALGAISRAGELLRAKGIVTSSYVEAMLDLYRRFGPYSVLAPGVAVPHASPADGALALGMGIVVLRHPICFGSPENDPVHLVIALASPENGRHWRALTELIELIQRGIAGSFRGKQSPETVAAILRSAQDDQSP